MNGIDGCTIIARDALEEILRETDYGKKLLERIIKKEFGLPVYVANVTLVSIIHDNKDDLELEKILANLRKYVLKIMPHDEKEERMPLFQDIHVSGTPWESARRWHSLAVRGETRFDESLQKMDILVWCDIALIQANNHIDQILTKNEYYGIFKRLSRFEKEYPKFFIKN